MIASLVDRKAVAIDQIEAVLLRKAFAERFISTAGEADLWFQMIVDRNLTSHAYDEELSERIYANILSKYAALLESASQRLQNLEWD